MKKFFIIFLFYFIIIFLKAQTPPQEPTLPKVEEPKSYNKEQTKANNSKKNLHKINLTIKLCDGRMVSGNFEYEKNEITLTHTKDGIQYQKTIQISEIKKILIHSWLGKKLKKTNEGWTYTFEAHDVSVYWKKDFFRIKGMFSSEFQKLSIQNENGVATLYTYWIDLQYNNGKWFSGLSSPKQNIREECHSDVIKTIELNTEE